MIKCNELQIGDWVKFPIGNDKVVDLPYIEGRGICASFAASATLFPVEIDKIEPIPLTPEILEKNGFGYYSIGGAEQWLIKDDYYDIKVYEWSDSIWVFKYDSTEMNTPHTQITLCYTHELQHALRLCGIDKETII